jgi:hypothetical protein
MLIRDTGIQLDNIVEEKISNVDYKETLFQGCGSGSGFRDLVDPDPYWESGSGSRGKKTKKFQWEKSTFWLFKKNLPLKRYQIALTTF